MQRLGFTLIGALFFFFASALPVFSINQAYIGTWTGSAQLATASGFSTKAVTAQITSASGAVFKKSYNVQNGQLTGIVTGSIIGSKIYFTGKYFVGEGTVSWDATKNKYKIVGAWQYMDEYYPYPYAAYFVVYR